MMRTAGIITATMVVLLLPGCGDSNKAPEQITPSSRVEKTTEESQPQDFVAVDQEPQLVKKVQPSYPDLARKAGLEGMVWVKIWVDTAGKARDVTILKSDAEIFNQATIDAAKQFEFKPARMKDRPIAVWVSVPFKYKLDDKPGSQGAKAATKPASPEEMSFMKGYVAAKEILLSELEKDAASARASGKPNAALEQKIQKLKAELPALREALQAMQAEN